MSGRARTALLTAGLTLLSCSVLVAWPFWTEALAFALLLTGFRLCLPVFESRFAEKGKWLYWLFLGILLLVIYVRWFI